MSKPPVITFEQVSKRFALHHDSTLSFGQRMGRILRGNARGDDSFWALRDVSFTMQRGEAVGLIGHNGSGKSTTLKLITRILEPTHGKITVNGRVSALLELGSGFHPDLTGRENIYLNGSLLGKSHARMRRKLEEIIDFSELEDFIDTPVKHYSSGMYMRLAFAIAISVEPDILITDEVLAVGDDSFQRKCLDRIYRFRNQGCTILFVSHGLAVVESLCDRVLWFERGILKHDGDTSIGIAAYVKAAQEQYLERMEEERRRDEERRIARGEEDDEEEEEPLDEEEEEPLDEEEEEEDDPFRWGSREIELVQVEVLDKSEYPRITFSVGETIILRMHYLAHERIEYPVFGISIHHRCGLHINGPNTRFDNYPIAVLEKKEQGTIDYIIDTFPFKDGEYLFSAAVYDYTMNHAYDHHHISYPFRVQTSGVRELGMMQIPAVWQWSGDTKDDEITDEPGEEDTFTDSSTTQPVKGSSVEP
jgi:lipopolysaccharide transport system ATP-binding protein